MKQKSLGRLLATLTAVCALSVGCGSISSSGDGGTGGGGSGGGTGGTSGAGGGGGAGGAGGGGHGGAGGSNKDAGGTDAGGTRGFCNTDSDCVWQPTDGCCGACLAIGDQPMPSQVVCTGACVLRPGGCSCVNHQCQRGVLTAGSGCNMQQDACGNGLKCCNHCNPSPDGGQLCTAPSCMAASGVANGQLVCPLTP
jgi:hypothetical protein